MKDVFIIKGGKPLKGHVFLSGAKNIALKIIIASLLCEGKVYINNIPEIKDFIELVNLLRQLGVEIIYDKKEKSVIVNPKNIINKKMDLLTASKIRVSFMLFAPLLYRFGQAYIPNPGGCRIGARPIDRQIDMLRCFGVTIDYDHSTGYYIAKVNKKSLQKAHYTFSKPSHTGTELAIMLASVARGESIIDNAALEPEIDDLIHFMNLAGCSIKRIDRKIYVQGRSKLKLDQPFKITNDRNEAVTFACFALAADGDITIHGIDPKTIDTFIKTVIKANGKIEISKDSFRVFRKGILKSTNIQTAVHPGFMTDWQAPWSVVMTCAKGKSSIHETVFEGRFGYVEELIKLGAKIELFQPIINDVCSVYQFNIEKQMQTKLMQAIHIYGPTRLHNGVMEVKDLRAGATVLIAGAVAEGISVIQGASIIDRGYERIEHKLKLLGADIKRE